MNRLTHSRAFISFLLVMLQLALLPSVGRCDGKLSLGSTCSCAGDASQAISARGGCRDREIDAVAHSCCSRQAPGEATPEGDPLGTGPEETTPKSKVCSCATSGGPGPALLTDSKNKKEQDRHLQVIAPVAAGTSFQSFDAVFARIHGGPTPKAPTGPPLHLLYQVFLI